jgi:hypothetical protein
MSGDYRQFNNKWNRSVINLDGDTEQGKERMNLRAVLANWARAWSKRSDDTRLDYYAEKLSDLKLGLLKEVLDHFGTTSTWMPKLNEIKSEYNTRCKSKTQKDPAEKRYESDLEMQNKKYSVAYKCFSDKCNGVDVDNKLLKWTQEWFEAIYGKGAIRNLKSQDLTLSLFSKPALFDLHDSEFIRSTAIALGRKKNLIVLIGVLNDRNKKEND